MSNPNPGAGRILPEQADERVEILGGDDYKVGLSQLVKKEADRIAGLAVSPAA
jgi:hypothetical protein